ncbi:Protein phosphatase methylesterase 1 [Trichinella murrelli]|uniref:protein phosphatase methylesterase-1 n=1 Tax=Trichinella murrelli TaxID=144512 RepID=A0A0V0UCW0_9BILA|nr:Protein phosphatase methylesterase 1 [Trichinella murrelli]
MDRRTTTLAGLISHAVDLSPASFSSKNAFWVTVFDEARKNFSRSSPPQQIDASSSTSTRISLQPRAKTPWANLPHLCANVREFHSAYTSSCNKPFRQSNQSQRSSTVDTTTAPAAARAVHLFLPNFKLGHSSQHILHEFATSRAQFDQIERPFVTYFVQHLYTPQSQNFTEHLTHFWRCEKITVFTKYTTSRCVITINGTRQSPVHVLGNGYWAAKANFMCQKLQEISSVRSSRKTNIGLCKVMASELEKSLHKRLLISSPPKSRANLKTSKRLNADRFQPLEWNVYFDKKETVKISDKNLFNVYIKGKDGPLLVFLHGGGCSALSWACLAVNSFIIVLKSSAPKYLSSLITCTVFAIDLRGHGETTTDDEYNLALEVMADDVAAVLKTYFSQITAPVILIGHSMGGAVAVEVAHSKNIPSLAALIVVDVSEGSALQALKCMQNYLLSRPKQFNSLPMAIEWSKRSSYIRNLESARVSMPGQVKKIQSVKENLVKSDQHPIDRIDEEAAELEEIPQTSDVECPESTIYGWRIDLSKTEKYWEGWYTGMSEKFLSISVPKLLLLANKDNMDTALTTAQMQGKFQMALLTEVGHSVHEDSPEKTAEIFASFLLRQRLAETLNAEAKEKLFNAAVQMRTC